MQMVNDFAFQHILPRATQIAMRARVQFQYRLSGAQSNIDAPLTIEAAYSNYVGNGANDMATSVLREFLRLQLIQGINEPEFEKLLKAVVHTRERLSSDPARLRHYAAALVDINLPDGDSALTEIRQDIEDEWNTFAGKYDSTPIALLRGVGLHALCELEPTESKTTRLLWLTASPRLELGMDGAEAELMRSLILEWGAYGQAEIETEWQASQAELLQASVDKVEPKQFDAKSLGLVEGAAAVNDGIASSLTAASQHLTTALNQQATALMKAVNSALASSVERMDTAIGYRLSLLWWKQALYSPALQIGYRRIQPPSVAVFAMAYDLSRQVSAYYPQSLEYLLRETALQITGEWSCEISEFCSELLADSRLTDLLKSASGAAIDQRVPLLTALSLAAQGAIDESDISTVVGVGDVSVDGPTLAVWLFREFAAELIVRGE